MPVEIVWTKGSEVRFRETDRPVDQDLVWPNLRWAKMRARAVATKQRDLWSARIKKIAAAEEQDIEVE